MQGEVIEDYPEDIRGHSCLLYGYGVDQRDIHVVCAPKEDFLAIITTYLPTDEKWEQGLRTRSHNELRPLSWTDEAIERPFSY